MTLHQEKDALYQKLKEAGEKKLPADPALMRKIKRVEKKIREMKE